MIVPGRREVLAAAAAFLVLGKCTRAMAIIAGAAWHDQKRYQDVFGQKMAYYEAGTGRPVKAHGPVGKGSPFSRIGMENDQAPMAGAFFDRRIQSAHVRLPAPPPCLQSGRRAHVEVGCDAAVAKGWA